MVSAFLDSVSRGPRALLVDGEAGIGKSTVWFEAVRLAEARGYRVLRARPAESEAKLSYAALADVSPAFEEARAAPHPQELTLAAALLRVTASEPADQRTVATAGPRRRAPDELTATERRVAELAAAGITNREIARAVFMSEKTVEAHIARVYRKLGIHSRAELGARMAGNP